MQKEHPIVKDIYEAKKDIQKADDVIRSYIPFIKSEASKCISGICTEQDDEFSIAMIAFHEAIMGYERLRGSFLKYASMLIKSRIVDYQRKEARHRGQISLYEEDENETILIDKVADEKDHYSELTNLTATKQEIDELTEVMEAYGVNFSDVADNCPKQERTLKACSSVICCAVENPEVLEELLRTKKLPMALLVSKSGVERKTLERHRKYIVAMLLIQTNGYEIIRGHLQHMYGRKGGL